MNSRVPGLRQFLDRTRLAGISGDFIRAEAQRERSGEEDFLKDGCQFGSTSDLAANSINPVVSRLLGCS